MAITINGTGSISGLSATGISAQPVFPGNILQVVQTVKTDTFSTNSSSYVDVTGLSVSITPSSSSNKVLVIAHLAGNAVNAQGAAPVLLRGSTIINQADSAGSRARSSFAGGLFTGDGAGDNLMVYSSNMTYLDSPATTSSVTYKVQVKVFDSFMYINRSQDDSDSADRLRGVSTITVMEVAA